jgi:hypothetical protein
MAKNPTFKLYRICDKKTGKAFQGFHGQVPYWTATGAFFRNPETIRKHIRTIIHNWHYEPRTDKLPYGRWVRGEEIKGRYKDFYVECYSVIALEKKTAPAAKYLGRKQ